MHFSSVRSSIGLAVALCLHPFVALCRDYLMDMCEYVPVRNRCRSLYLHVAVCICRRVEFIEGYELDQEKIRLDEHGG